MSFFIAAILGGLSGVLYLAGERQAFTTVCRYTFDPVPAPELAALSCGGVSDTRDAVPAAEVVRARAQAQIDRLLSPTANTS